MNCTGAMEYKNIKLLKNWLAITDGNTTFEVKKGIDTVTGKRGFQMEIVAEFKSQNFATVPPNHLEISSCSVGYHRSMIQLGGGAYTSYLVPLLKGTIENVACQFIQQMGQLKDGRRGFASKQLQRINQLIQNMSSSPYIDPIKAQDEVLRNIGESNADDVVQLDSDVFYSIASYAVNNVLGGRAKEGTENDDLLVNGMARKLLYNERRISTVQP